MPNPSDCSNRGLDSYGCLKGRPLAGFPERDLNTPHFQVHVDAGGTEFRVPVNVRSVLQPPDLLYFADENYEHPMLARIRDLPLGFTSLDNPTDRAFGGRALDFIRGNLFDRSLLRVLPHNVPDADNDLNDKLDHFIQRAINDDSALLYAFGERWGPESGQTDAHFDFNPGNGVHDIHMNQGSKPGIDVHGNPRSFEQSNGVFQDGALLIHFADDDRWIAIFTAFQSQDWHTDDVCGMSLEVEQEADGDVVIVAALPNPVGGAPENETVLILNRTPQAIDLTGWSIADRLDHRDLLSGTIGAGESIAIALSQQVQLGNSGGEITLLNAAGLKVHGVSYTRNQAPEGWTVVF